MSHCQNHGLKGLTDDTDGTKRVANESVQSHNPWQSVIQTPPPGYKQTELGVIPADWDVIAVSDITTSHKQGFYTKDRYVEQGTYLVRITDLLNPRISFADMPKLKVSQGDYNLFRIKRGDFLFARSGAIGRYGIVYDDIEAIFGSYIIRFTFDAKRVVNEYFGFLYETELVWKQLLSITQGSSNININANNIKSLRIPLPPLPEQRAITALDRLIAKKRDIKRATMQELLTGKHRLPGFSGEWQIKTIGEMFQFLSTANNPRSDLIEHGEVKYIHYGDVHTIHMPFLDCDSIALPAIDADKVLNVPFVEDGDLVMVDASEDYGGLGTSVELKNTSGKKIVAGLHTLLLRGDKEMVGDGFKGYLQYIPSFKNSLTKIATGISVYGISKNNLKDVAIQLPDVPEQQAIAEILSDMDAEIAALEQKRDKVRLLKQGMMQELLTGKTQLIGG